MESRNQDRLAFPYVHGTTRKSKLKIHLEIHLEILSSNPNSVNRSSPNKQISLFNLCHYQTVAFFCSNLQFSTKDVDNDLHPDNCAGLLSGAWWYHSCSWANLNGLYRRGSYNTSYLPHGVKLVTFRGQYYSLKRTEMKLKPKP